jgi:hypothetical protein
MDKNRMKPEYTPELKALEQIMTIAGDCVMTVAEKTGAKLVYLACYGQARDDRLTTAIITNMDRGTALRVVELMREKMETQTPVDTGKRVRTS